MIYNYNQIHLNPMLYSLKILIYYFVLLKINKFMDMNKEKLYILLVNFQNKLKIQKFRQIKYLDMMNMKNLIKNIYHKTVLLNLKTNLINDF